MELNTIRLYTNYLLVASLAITIKTAAALDSDKAVDQCTSNATTYNSSSIEKRIINILSLERNPTNDEFVMYNHLTSLLGREPRKIDFARDERLRSMPGFVAKGSHPTFKQHVNDSLLQSDIGHSPTAADYKEQARLSAVLGKALYSSSYERDAFLKTIPGLVAIGAHPTKDQHEEDIRLGDYIDVPTSIAHYALNSFFAGILARNPQESDYLTLKRDVREIVGHKPVALEMHALLRLRAQGVQRPTPAQICVGVAYIHATDPELSHESNQFTLIKIP